MAYDLYTALYPNVAMANIILLCILPLISTEYCQFPNLTLHSFTSPKCALPLPVCVDEAFANACNNPKCVLHSSLSLAVIQITEASICAYNNLKCALFPSLLLPRYDVFLNHRGADLKETVASLIFHNLENKGFKVFLDKNSIQGGEPIPQVIEMAIYSSKVHLVIFSVNYADSIWCLKKLDLILRTGAPIIPVFHGVEPSELRMKDEKSVYARAFQMHKRTGHFEPIVLDQWKKALHEVSYRKGHFFKGDQGESLERIAANVAELVDVITIFGKSGP